MVGGNKRLPGVLFEFCQKDFRSHLATELAMLYSQVLIREDKRRKYTRWVELLCQEIVEYACAVRELFALRKIRCIKHIAMLQQGIDGRLGKHVLPELVAAGAPVGAREINGDVLMLLFGLLQEQGAIVADEQGSEQKKDMVFEGY